MVQLNAYSGTKLTPFASIKTKTIRAKQLANGISNIFGLAVQSGIMEYTMGQDTDGTLIITVTSVRPLHWETSLLVSEAIHHLRTALDHIAWQISTPTPGNERDVYFPVCTSEEEFQRRQPKRLPGATAEALNLIRRFQPFPTNTHPRVHLLLILAALNNWDKHNELLSCTTAIQGSNITYKVSGAAEIIRTVDYTGVVEPGVVLARIEVGASEAGAGITPELRFNFRPVFHSAMPEEFRHMDTLSFINETADLIESEITPALKDHFKE